MLPFTFYIKFSKLLRSRKTIGMSDENLMNLNVILLDLILNASKRPSHHRVGFWSCNLKDFHSTSSFKMFIKG